MKINLKIWLFQKMYRKIEIVRWNPILHDYEYRDALILLGFVIVWIGEWD